MSRELNNEVKNIDVSIIMVNWNTGKHLQKTVDLLENSAINILYEVILVDNNSSKDDNSYKYIENVL